MRISHQVEMNSCDVYDENFMVMIGLIFVQRLDNEVIIIHE